MTQTNNYINGQWVAGEDNIPNVNPSDTRETIGEFAQASPAQVEEAIASAQGAQKSWAGSGLEQRYNVLMAIDFALDYGHSVSLGLICLR